QAEDGIRDFHVTGVQTCALPISDDVGFRPLVVKHTYVFDRSVDLLVSKAAAEQQVAAKFTLNAERVFTLPSCFDVRIDSTRLKEIGRASCRERGAISVVAGVRTK